ncbi:MAG: hypothetical protein AB2556_25420 [Candidatus Thiodiazotropha sp.]
MPLQLLRSWGHKKQDEIHVLAESRLNSTSDHISITLNDDKISDEQFRLIQCEIDKYYQMKEEIREHLKQGLGLSEDQKKKLHQRARDKAILSAHTKLLEELNQAGINGTSQ